MKINKLKSSDFEGITNTFKNIFNPQHILQQVETAGIKFPDNKTTGVSLRSQRIKLPANVGQKKSKGIEQMLQELEIGTNYFNKSKIKILFI